MNESSIYQMRVEVAETGARLFSRNLLDLAGGNISARVGDVICISPRYSGPKHHWALTPEDVMVVTPEGEILEGTGELSRESKVHLKLHREFGEYGGAVIHAHARNVMVFAAMARPLPPVMEATRKFGEIQVINFAPSHTAELSDHVAAGIRGQEARIRKHAAAVIAPYHGLFCMGRDLDLTSDAVERLDTNAYCILMGQILTMGDALSAQRASMETVINGFEERNAVR
jgi:ribulose-5-phosphate 4-epimerase/fuculose-1-phosphate aldolase